MSNYGAIGVFDSGLGGLTVVKEIKKLHPKAKIVYLGDTARVPYGTRSKETVVRFALEDARFLEKKGVECVVIACNTASALAYKEVKKVCKVPVYEVISAARQQAERVGTRIGVIGTRGTIRSGAYGHIGVACPLLVPFIEEGELNSPALEIVLKDYLKKFPKIDTLILGCTHYPIIAKVIGKIMGPKVKLINPAEELAKKLPVENPSASSGLKDEYYVTDMTPRYKEVAKRFLGWEITPKLVKLG